ncbi:MAG: reverse transcriptase domain-containing protein [Bacteroidota bacterium]
MNDVPNLGLYLKLFRGREDYFAQQGEDWYFPVPKALDEIYLNRHLEGDATFGLYVLNRESCCHLVCIDIDIPKSDLGEVDFANPSEKHGYLKHKLDAVLEALSGTLGVPPESILLEETGGRGYHIWVFFSGPVQGRTAVTFGKMLNARLDFEIEFFPKQGRLTPNRKYGNLIKLPLGIHQKYGSRSSFFCLSSQGLQAISGIAENLAHLRVLVPLDPEVLDRSIAAFAKELPLQDEAPTPMIRPDQQRPQFEGDSATLITQCTAMHNLRARAEAGSRLSHSEAFHFADVMLSVPDGVDIVHDTMRLSFAADYDRNRAQNEIERIMPLYPPSCLTLVRKGVCPRYCKESVRKRNEDPLVSGTTPCSVWLRRMPAKPITDAENLVNRIGAAENLKRAFFQLRQYHEHEDALFFDPFDFEHFEGRLDANCAILAKALRDRSEIPFVRYMPVSVPKKINEAQELEYREMSYSTVYDQAPIQAIFNVVAPIVESEFQSTSYGYLWNADTGSPYRIFEDWREAYPRFRNDIMAALERHPNGFHVCFDIKGYYDHVDHSILLEQLRKFIPDTYVYQMIERRVRAYTFTTQGGCGLPQGPAYARLLANLYLNDFDTFAGQVATAYFRYVDDFVLVFESEKDAEQGLERVVLRLAELGLELSQDEAKKPVIEPNTDISRVRKTLDKIHYGILEGTRHVEHLAPEAVEDFMAAVKRHSVSPVTLEELIKINDVLPSLLYVVTQESLFPHRLKPIILSIVEFLIQHRWFCPKKLKTIFYRFLDLGLDENRLRGLFLSLEPIHKVYFLLSVFGCWQSRDEHRRLLERLVCDGLRDNSVYVLGFAVAIAAKLDMDIDTAIERQALMRKLSETDGFFGLLKWLPTIDYLNQSDDERAGIRNLLGPRSPDLLKVLLFANVTRLPTVYVDSVYLDGLLRGSGVLLLPGACDLLVNAMDRGEFFDSVLRFILSRLAFKPLVISFVTKGIFDKRAVSGVAEIENLKSLYTYVHDDELKQCMLGAVSRIMQYGLANDEEFAKRHRVIDRYNECFLFEMLDEGARYEYLELIPEGRLRDNIHCDLDEFKAIVDDFGAKKILPGSNVLYDSSKKEVRLEFRTDQRYRVLDPTEFSLTPGSVLRACVLAAEIYRKACYFRRFTGKAPDIRPDNLLIDAATGSVVFRTVGRSLCAAHVLAGTIVGDEESDIARMLSTLLETLIFKSPSELKEFMQENTCQGVNAFLSLFIKNMRAKDPRHRYSCPRFVYLVDQLRRTGESNLPKNWLEVIYLRERLKGALFRFNSQVITWDGVCRTLNEHLSNHIRAVCSRDALRAFPFRSRVLFSGRGKPQLHAVSRHLLDLALCRDDVPDTEKDNAAYLDLVEFLLLYATICLEIVALGRTLRNSRALQTLSLSPLLARDSVLVRAGGYETNVAAGDLAAMVIRQPRETTDEATVGLSLRQISLQALFACGIAIDDAITVKKPETLRDEVFRIFSHACLVRIPSVEIAVENELRQVCLALRSNEDFSRLEWLEEMRNTVTILAQDLRRVRSGLRLSRQHGRADGRYFPPDVRFRSWFHWPRRVKEHALPGCALTNSFPSSQEGYICSLDVNGTSVTNLMIPSEGLNSLIRDLTRGKILGFKLFYLYSGRAMIFWDGTALVVSALALAFCEFMKGSTIASTGVKVFFSVLTYPLGALAVSLLVKLLVFDLGHWVSWYRQVIMYIRQKFYGESEPPESNA